MKKRSSKPPDIYARLLKAPLGDNELRVTIWRRREGRSLRFSISGQIAPDASPRLVDDLCAEIVRKIQRSNLEP